MRAGNQDSPALQRPRVRCTNAVDWTNRFEHLGAPQMKADSTPHQVAIRLDSTAANTVTWAEEQTRWAHSYAMDFPVY